MIAEEPYRAIFTYGVDNQRKKMVVQKLHDGTTDDYYDIVERHYSGSYEKVRIWDNDNLGWNEYGLTYIAGGDGLCAIHVDYQLALGSTGEEIYYIHKDYLGSILALSDAQGTVVGRQSFDAWGRYRNPSTWEVFNSNPSEGGVFDPNVIDMPEWFSRGYTGHEHMREFDLINMNGRLYDPIPGRMLSADNFVQDPGSSQSYNRYTYAFNNPLKYTDPSGEFNIWAALGTAVAAAGISYFGNVINNNGEWNPNNWTSGAVTVGLASNGSTVDLYGGGSIAGNSFVAGRNISTGIWGGGSSSFGQASYSQVPNAGTGDILLGLIIKYRGWGDTKYYDFGGSGIDTPMPPVDASLVAGEGISVNQSAITPVNVLITDQIVGNGLVRAYPDRTGSTLYRVPLYKVTVRNSVNSEDFQAIRFGVQNVSGGVGPRVVGLSDAQTHNLSWRSYGSGFAWTVYGGWLIHEGAADPTTQAWGAIGCIEICGPGAWNRFNDALLRMSGAPTPYDLGVSGMLTATYQYAPRPPLIPVTP